MALSYDYLLRNDDRRLAAEVYDAPGSRVDSDGDTTIEITTEYTFNDDGVRIRQILDNGTNVTRTDFVISNNNHTGYAQTIEGWQKVGRVPLAARPPVLPVPPPIRAAVDGAPLL